jgi:15-cis-phytoene synthase
MTANTPLSDDVTLALHYAPAALKPAMETLFGLDTQLGIFVAEAREPQLTMIRLAWWRDQLDGLECAPGPADPMLASCQTIIRDCGVSGTRLAGIAEGWMTLLGAEAIDHDAIADYAAQRGKSLFDAIGQCAGLADTGDLGVVFALADFARRSDDANAKAVAIAAMPPLDDVSIPKSLRPLALLADWGRRDIDRMNSGRPLLTMRARAWSALWFAPRKR